MNPSYSRSIALLTVAAFFAVPYQAVAASKVWVETRRAGDMLDVTGFAQSDTALDAGFQMTVSKSGASGSVNSAQAGVGKLLPNSPTRLSQSQVSVARGDIYCIKLALTAAGKQIGADSLVLRWDNPKAEHKPCS